MTASASRVARRAGLIARVRLTGAGAAVAALTAIIVIGPPGRASAATNNYDQMTGAGSTDSAITVPWTQGLLDSTNQPITNDFTDPASNSARAAGTGPLSFMFGDFKNLVVTVSQTQDITQQGITVSWTGGQPTLDSAALQGNYLQMMECYGDAATGPNPEDCEFGSTGLLSSTQLNGLVGDRTGYICAPGAVASTTSPPSSVVGLPPQFGCDPGEPGTPNPPHIGPNQARGSYTIPFVPVSDPANPAYNQVAMTAYFNQFNTDEIQQAVTGTNDGGRVQFETLTATQAPGLGCGELENTGQPRGCWLVIVPRGQYEPNGYKISGGLTYLNTSPLSASNWAQRIQIHLGFATVPAFCPIGTKEVETVGTQIAAQAVQSWQLALNAQANCAKIYGYSAVPEATSTNELASSDSGIGLAFTTIPIGSEGTRPGSGNSGGAPNLPPIVYAPVAVTALGFGFNINQASGYVSTAIKLTPEVLARALTQSYLTDLPDYYLGAGQGAFPGPAWAQRNPANITLDPQFHGLNTEVTQTEQVPNLAPLLTVDHSALNQSVWQWIQADKAAVDWLDGTATTDPVTADPDYTALQLGTTPTDSFPRAYSQFLDLGLSLGTSPKEEIKRTLDLLPYSNGYAAAAQAVLTATNSSATNWDITAVAPDGSSGWWLKTGTEQLGAEFMWALSDTPDLAKFGLIDAQLCNDDGSNCVEPSTASVTTALNSAKKGSAGLLEVNPASPGAGGYPLVDVIYAAVPTNQSAAALADYAALINYATGDGQKPGVAPGNLPPGYLPMPASLVSDAKLAVQQLQVAAAIAGGTPTTASPLPAASVSTPTTGGTGGAIQPTAPAATFPSSAYMILQPKGRLVAGTTPRQPVGAVRWALLAVVLAGAACAVGGAVLRSARVPRWLQRLRS